jgi:tetratricopeptide (TPR) repeat protein
VPGTLGNIAITLAALGRFGEAERAGREAMLAGERVASRIHYNLAALQLARALFSLGRWDEALDMVDEVAADTEPANRGMLIGVPVLLALHRGRPARAREVLDQFDREQAQSGAAFESDYRSLRDAALAHLAQDPVQAKGVVDRAQPGDYAEWPTWLPLAVDVVAQVGDEPAMAEIDAALRRDIVPSTTPVVTAQIARVRALLAARAGDRAGAAASWSTAIAIADRTAMPFDAAVLRLERVEHLPEHADARADAEMARGVFAELKAGPWLERAQEALAAGGAVRS